MAEQTFVYAGTYANRGGKGIYRFRFRQEDGGLEPLGTPAPAESPSFLALHPSGNYLYATNENDVGTVTAYSIDADGALTELNGQPSHGAAPCHLTCDRSGRVLIVVNYTSGTVSSYPIAGNGHLAAATQTIQHAGSSVLPRQTQAHAHSVNIDAQNRFAYIADLGIDKVMIYEMDLDAATLSVAGSLETAPGAGPRHFAFHPNDQRAYLINEIGCTLTALRYDRSNGQLHPINTLATVPGEVEPGFSTADVHVHPNGKFVYGSNRGHNSIACFQIGDDGAITFVARTPVEPVPRNFAIDPDGHFLLSAGQDTGTTTSFRIDPQTGALTPTGAQTSIPGCVCLQFLVR
jgi:6-phosphogluconolactonase